MVDAGPAVRTLRERIDQGDRGHPEDAETLLEFSDRLFEAQPTLGDKRHLKYLRHATKLSEAEGPIQGLLYDEDKARVIVRYIHTNYSNAYTNKDFRLTLRKLGRLCTPGDDLPESVAWIPASLSNDVDPLPERESLLTWDDVEEMASAARNARDAALCVVAMELGARSSELRQLKIGDIHDGKQGVRVRIDGAKNTGRREVPLIRSVDRLNRWLSMHPRSGDSSAPLWCGLDSGEDLSYRAFRDALDRCADRADMADSKDVTPTGFRKASATWLARTGMNAAHIEDRQGRARGSDAVRHYISRFGGDDAEDAYLTFLGHDDADGAPTCPRCDANVSDDAESCLRCGQMLDGTAAARTDEVPEADRREQIAQIARDVAREEVAAEIRRHRASE